MAENKIINVLYGRKRAFVPVILRGCGSSIAHGKCIYAGEIVKGAPTCDARDKVRNGCQFRNIATVFEEIDADDARLRHIAKRN